MGWFQRNLPAVLIIFVIVAVVAVTVSDNRISKEEEVKQKPEIKFQLSISDRDKKALIAHAYAALDKFFEREFISPSRVPEIKDYNKVHVTLLVDNKIRCSKGVTSYKSRLGRTEEDLVNAIAQCINDDRFGGVLNEEEVEGTSVIINFYYNETSIEGKTIDELKSKFERGIHGLEIEKGENRAFYNESVPIIWNYSGGNTIKRLCKNADLDEKCFEDPDVRILRFDTFAFTGDRDRNTKELYRYNTTLEIDDITPEFLDERIALVANWFKQNVNKETGLMEYQYSPSSDKYSDDNNHVRQMATVWAAAALANRIGDEGMDPYIKTSLDYYLSHAVKKDDYCYFSINDKNKLAFNAFLIFALLEFDEYPDAENWIKLVANGILNQQQEDGSYFTYFDSDSTSGMDYYPGEAMYSLMKLYEKTGEERYKESVEKAFPYYREYWRGNKNTAFVPWHTQTYLPLYKDTKNEELADFVFEMNDWLIDGYQILDHEYDDYIGGYPKGKPNTRGLAYAESVGDAYAVAKLAGDEEHIRKYTDSLEKSIRYILLTQYTDENSFYLDKPHRAIGGVKRSVTSNKQRVDYVQHAMFALIKASEHGLFE